MNSPTPKDALVLKFPDEVRSLMQGALDLHLHPGPSLIPRRLDIAEAALQAAATGLAAVLMKDHHLPTVRDIHYVKKYALPPEVKVDLLGAIALNHSIGGLNPYAVETALAHGARIVYLPTVSSRPHSEHHQKEVAGAHFPATAKPLLKAEPIDLLDARGKLPKELTLIMEQVRDADAVLSAGHLSVPEINAVLDQAKALGLKRLMVNHPTFIIEANDRQMLEFAKKGALIEFSACMSDPRCKFYYMPAEELCRLVKLLGVDSVSIGSDLGQHDTPPFVEGLMVVADGLLQAGLKTAEVRKLFKDNPAKLVY
jgi:hypothetical protein